MNLIKLSLFIIICLMTQISKAQKVSVMWNNTESSNFKLIGPPFTIEMNGNYYCIALSNRRMNTSAGYYYLLKLDDNLNVEKHVEFPYKYNGNILELVNITKGTSKIIILFKYYDTNGENRMVLLKAVFDEKFSNTIELEKVTDIQTMGETKPQHVLNLFNYNENGDVILMSVPREAFSFNNYTTFSSYTFSSYNSDFSKNEWNNTMSLGKLGEDYEIKSGYFSIKKEYIFVMKAKMKAFRKVNNSMLICKYSNEKGIEKKELKLDGVENSNDLYLYINSNTNVAYVYGFLEKNSIKEDIIFIKKFNINTLEELSDSRINLGLSKSNGIKANGHDLFDFSFRGMGRNGNSNELILMGEIYRNNVDRNTSGTILYLKLDNNGKMLDKKMIPRLMHVKNNESYKPHFGSFLGSKVNDKFCFLFYDSPNNENLTEFDSKIKVKYIEDNEKQDLYMITIDENNNISKTKVNKTNSGNMSKLNKKQNFEILTNTYISPGKFFVMDGTNIGILTIE